MKYERQNCVHCGREFAKNDDIVVCPICGTPHHRECWADGNGCGNAFRHEEGYAYKNPNQPDGNGKTEKCLFCGSENPEISLVCHNCGGDLTKGSFAQGNTQGNMQGGMPFTFEFTPPKNPYEDSDEMIDDVPVKEVAKRVMIKTEYYIPKFKKISKRRIPFSWNWAAFLMPTCVWFYYRKCYLAGTLAAIFDIVVQVLFNGFLTNVAELTVNGYSDAVAVAELYRVMFSPTGLAFLGISVGFRVLMGLSGNALYKTQVLSDIRKKKESIGGTNFIIPAIGYLLFSYLTSFILTLIG